MLKGSSADFIAKLNTDGVLQWNTFVEGLASLYGAGITLDNSGNIYNVGISVEPWSCKPVNCTVRPFSGGYDTYATKISASGVLLWNTFLGGGYNDNAKGVALDLLGNVYVTGFSHGTWGVPVRAYTPGDDPIHPNTDAFVAKLDAGGGLLWNTFLGGSGDEEGSYGYGGIAVDKDNNAYVVADSTRPWSCAPISCTVRAFTLETPVTSFQVDAFVARVNPDGVLQWNTFLGGQSEDEGSGITVDKNNNVYVTGTSSNDWGSPAPPFVSGEDAFVAKLNPAGNLLWNGFVAGTPWQEGHGIAVDDGGNVFIGGKASYTWGTPVHPFNDGWDIFVAKLAPLVSTNANLGGLVLSTGAVCARVLGGEDRLLPGRAHGCHQLDGHAHCGGCRGQRHGQRRGGEFRERYGSHQSVRGAKYDHNRGDRGKWYYNEDIHSHRKSHKFVVPAARAAIREAVYSRTSCRNVSA